MGVLDDAFDSLATEVVGQLARGTITIARPVRGALNTTTLKRAETTASGATVAAVRSASRPALTALGGSDGGDAMLEEWDYLVATADLVTALGAAFLPVEGDRITDSVNGQSNTYAITMVERQVNEMMVKLTVRGVRQRQT